MTVLHGEIFTSVYKLSILAQEEGKLLKAFTKYIVDKGKDGEQISYELQRLINDLEPLVSESCLNPSYSENPINSYHLIGRFVYKWQAVYNNILCEACDIDIHAERLNNTFQEVGSHIVHWPDEYDVKSTAEALLRLRVFYYLNIEELIDGNLGGDVVLALNPSQVIKIINLAVDSNMLNEAILWCEALLRKIPFNSHQDENINMYSLLKLLASIFNKAGMPKRAAYILSDLTSAGNIDINNDYELYNKLANTTEEQQDISLVPIEYDDEYKQLCRENRKDVADLSALYCYYSNTTIPYHKGKVEVVNLHPKIVLFHDVLSEGEISYIRNQGSENFQRSELVGTTDRAMIDSVRVSETSWVHDAPGVIRRITDRVSLLTGLATLNCTEPFQVVNYGIGGMYHPHLDALETDMKDNDVLYNSGDRIATWMFYLNDVTAGGATVFPEVNARVPVVKGGAAFWYNLLPSGESDKRTLHAGCPVLLGSKWIGNKWIREAGQIFKRPCDLQP